MKMVKKILLGLVTGALVLAFVGCKPPEGGDSDAITESSFWGKSADINKVNEVKVDIPDYTVNIEPISIDLSKYNN